MIGGAVIGTVTACPALADFSVVGKVREGIIGIVEQRRVNIDGCRALGPAGTFPVNSAISLPPFFFFTVQPEGQ